MFGKLRHFPRLIPAALALAAAGACSEQPPDVPPALNQLYFPTGIALTPEVPGQEQLLLVVSSNLDLRFRSGVLHAFDRATIDQLADTATAPNCPPEAPGCSPGRAPDLSSALRGAVEIGSFGGDVAVAQLPAGGLRAFVPVRAEGDVVAVDVDPGAGTSQLRCAHAGAPGCIGVPFPRLDPFGVVTAQGNVYVSHIGRDTNDSPEAVVGAAFADAPMWSGGAGAFSVIGLGEHAVGGISARCGAGEPATCTLFASGRSLEDGFNPVYLFDFRAGELRSGPVFSRNVFSQQRGLDTRGIAASSAGDRVFVASRFPAGLATIDVSRISTAPTPGCVVPPGASLPGGACPEGPVPLDGEREPRFVTADLVPSPAAPNAVFVLPRTLSDGTSSDLVILTVEQGLAFFDTRTGTFAGAVEQVGSAPAALAAAARPDGSVRLYVPSFGRGTLSVVDIPDPLRPGNARVVAILGRQQEGAF